MKNNYLGIKTLHYIWSHPNCRQNRIQSVLRFWKWQIYKRLNHQLQNINFIPGVKLHGYKDSAATSAVYYCGLYDYDEMNFLLRYLRTEDSFLDIGANIGVYTLLAASIIKTGTIHSFEVLSKNYQRLQDNLRLNQFKQVTTYDVAVSDISGEVELNLLEGDSLPFITQKKDENTITVITNTLDNLLKSEQISNLTIAKIDIEGAEILAFKGATSLLQRQLPSVWIMEINDTVNSFNHKKEDVVNFLKSYGYSLYSYSADANEIQPIDLYQQKGNNVLAIARYQQPIPQAILTLGGGVYREKFTAQFAKSYPSLPIWVSTGSNPNIARKIFQAAGIAERQIYLDRRATDTVTNFTSLVADFNHRNFQHIYLITSDFHMPRAKAIARIDFTFRAISRFQFYLEMRSPDF